MIRVLTMIAVAGFVLSVACLSVAISLAGPEAIAEGMWGWNSGRDWNWTWSHSSSDSDGPQTVRELAWSGDSLSVNIPADVQFTQADGPAKLVLRGPKSVIDGLTVSGGIIGPKVVHQGESEHAYDDAGVTIELTAPKVTRFQVYGSGRVEIHDYRQDRLAIGLFGANEVTATGAAKHVELTINGSGSADLADLKTDDATVTMAGSGSAKVGPTTSAKVEIAGSGDVTLTSKPKQEHINVTGSGHVEHDDGASSDSSDDDSDKTKT